MKTKEQRDKDRLKRAQEIADGLKRGYYDHGIPGLSLSNYPPRPKVKKAQDAIRKLYGEEQHNDTK